MKTQSIPSRSSSPESKGRDMGASSRHDVHRLIGRRAVQRWERSVVGDLLYRLCWSMPDKEAIVGGAGAYCYPEFSRLTYRAADALANRIANALIARGQRQGDRLLFVCDNSVEAYVAKIGAAKAGIVCAPINPKLAEDALDHLLTLTEPAFAIVDAEHWQTVEAMLRRHGIEGAIIPIGGDVVPERWITFADFVADSPETEPDVEIHADDIWQLMPTSGTTSLPKAVMQSHAYAYAAANSYVLVYTRGIRFESDLRTCVALPLIYHATDQAHSFPVFFAGGTLIIGRSTRASDVAELVSGERATALFGGSSHLLRAVADAAIAERCDLSTLSLIIYTWTPVPPEVLATLKRLCGPQLLLCGHLGQTEVLATTRFWPDKTPETYFATAPYINNVGVPCPYLAAAVMTEDGRLLDPNEAGQPGEVVYRTPAIASGYYRDEAATAAAFRDGWFHSGDCCAYDDDGMLVMLDRFKDVIKSGGENVSSGRVEAVLALHDAIDKAAVVGLVHPKWGEAVTAFVRLRDGECCTEEELAAFVRQRLARFEVPKAIRFVESFPETVGGKVLKHLLRAEHVDLYRTEGAGR